MGTLLLIAENIDEPHWTRACRSAHGLGALIRPPQQVPVKVGWRIRSQGVVNRPKRRLHDRPRDKLILIIYPQRNIIGMITRS